MYGITSLLAVLIAVRHLPETNLARVQAINHPIVWSRAWLLLLLVTLVTGASWAFLPTGLVWALLPAHLGRLADRFRRKPMMILGLAAAAVSSMIIPALSSVVAFAGLWALQALCFAAGDPAEQALVADLTGGDQRDRAYGLHVMAADLGATIGPIGGAWLYQSAGPQAPFFANGIVVALCAGALAVWLRVPTVSPGTRGAGSADGGSVDGG